MNRRAVDFTTFEGCILTLENLIRQNHPALRDHTMKTISSCLLSSMEELLIEPRHTKSLEAQEERRKYISLILGSFSIIYPSKIDLLDECRDELLSICQQILEDAEFEGRTNLIVNMLSDIVVGLRVEEGRIIEVTDEYWLYGADAESINGQEQVLKLAKDDQSIGVPATKKSTAYRYRRLKSFS